MKTFLPFVLPFLITITLLSIPVVNFGQAPDLRTAGDFALFTSVGAVSNTGSSQISGKVGTNTGAITGFDTSFCEIHNTDAVTAQSVIDLQSACTQIDNTPFTSLLAPLLGNGQILSPGVYSIASAATLNADLTLDAQGDSNAVFIFQILGAFSTTAYSEIILINGALAANVFWKITGGAIAMATGTIMKGILIANDGAISMATGCTLIGKALSATGAIAIDGIILPVTILGFKATNEGTVIALQWTTANEFSLASYKLERSADGRNFYEIGSVTATNTAYTKVYNQVDNSPLIGVSFYRLKMIDIGGVYKYSMIVKIDRNAKKSISVYPNPVTDHTMLLQMYGQLKGDHILNLYNNNGEKVMSGKMSHDGNDLVKSINLDQHLQGGVYYLEVVDPQRNKATIKIIIK